MGQGVSKQQPRVGGGGDWGKTGGKRLGSEKKTGQGLVGHTSLTVFGKGAKGLA